MERQNLPTPASLHDIYMHDQCQSLRILIDILTPKEPTPAADAPVELREPEKPKAKHRDQLLAYEAQAIAEPPAPRPEMTGAVQVEPTAPAQPERKAQRGPIEPAQKAPETPRRQAKPN